VKRRRPRRPRKTFLNHRSLWTTVPSNRLLTREFIHKSLWMILGATLP
jgi:hypothetical protein